MKRNWKIDPAVFFGVLCFLFLVFSLTIYLKPLKETKIGKIQVEKATKGRLIWQKYNCQSCHQLYGLGGYLGPDLTNTYRKINGSQEVLHYFLTSGNKQMPSFQLTSEEEQLLLDFLKFTNESGSADPRDYETLSNGMIEQNGKNR